MEEWRKIPGLPDRYEASSLGRIRRADHYVPAICSDGNLWPRAIRAKIFAFRRLSPKGYQRVNLCGRVYFVHRLIALAFIPNINGLPQINHKNGIKTANNIENLEWVTNQENRDHAVKTGLQASGERMSRKLTQADVLSIRAKVASGVTQRTVGALFNIGQQTVSKIVTRRSWRESSPA